MTATSLWVEKHRRVPPPERKDPGGMAAADPRQASLPRVCRRPQQNCSHQPVPKQELIRTITASLEKLWAVKNVSLSWSPHACRRVWPLWRKKSQCQGWRAIMPLAQFKHILRWLSIHITAKKKITSGPSGLITMQQHQPIFSGALWLHCRLQGLLLRGPKKTLLRQNMIFFLALRCWFRKFIRLRRLFRTRAQRMLGTNREKTQNLQSFAQLNSP